MSAGLKNAVSKMCRDIGIAEIDYFNNENQIFIGRDSDGVPNVIKAYNLIHASEQRRFNRSKSAHERLSKPTHRNVVQTIHVEWMEKTQVGIVTMPYISGDDWERRACKMDALPLDPRAVMTTGMDMIRALCHVHKCGLIHLDVKLANFIRTPTGTTLILDFDLSMVESDTLEFQRGTKLYMPPEMFDGHSITNPRACDVFSLGLTLYALLFRHHAFFGCSNSDPNAIVRSLREVFKTKGLDALLDFHKKSLPKRLVDIIVKVQRDELPILQLLRGLLHSDPEKRWTLDRAEAAVVQYLKRAVHSEHET